MKVTTTVWTCDRCGRVAETSVSSEPPQPGGMPPPPMMMTPPMPVGWREYVPQSSTVLLCEECNRDFAAWVLIMPPPSEKRANA